MSTNLSVNTPTDAFELEGRLCSLSAFSFLPIENSVPKERTVFNSTKQSKDASKKFVYDGIFAQNPGFNNKLHRDDRAHHKLMGLNAHSEEMQKPVPSLNSTLYGFQLENELDPPDRKNVRIQLVNSEFYRRNGIEHS